MKDQKRHYYVDEAGDLTLFNKKGKVIIGQEGCSKFFFLGIAHIIGPSNARKELALLKKNVLSDPYLENIPSIKNKTKIAFHAKDDCPEVRKEDRFFNYVKDKFVRIIDLDDKRLKDYGVYYDSRNELTVQKIRDSLVG